MVAGALLAGAAAVCVLLLRGACTVTPDPSAELVTQLKRYERSLEAIEIDGSVEPLRPVAAQYARITIDVHDDRVSAIAIATLDLEGRLGETTVSSLGHERIEFRREGRRWTMDSPAPNLARVVGALERRRRVLETGTAEALASLAVSGRAVEPSRARSRRPADDSSGEARGEAPGTPPDERPSLSDDARAVMALTNRSYGAKSWWIRVERGRAQVTEAFRLRGDARHRPFALDGRVALRLLLDERDMTVRFERPLM